LQTGLIVFGDTPRIFAGLKLLQGRLIPQQLDQSTQLPIGGIELQHKKFGTYPPALQDLATYEEGWCEGYATEPVFTGKYSGYRFANDPPPSTLGPRNKFFFSAVPFAPENKGGREFCADQSGAIRVATKGITCTTNSHELREEDDFSRLKLP